MISFQTSMKRYQKYIRRKWASISYKRPIDLRLNEPVISFTFDDAPGSAFVNGGNILSKYGMCGTFYISLSLMHDIDPSVRFTADHVRGAIERNHEIGCHTYGHTELYTVSLEKGMEDIDKNQLEMQNIAPGTKLENFSYPFGSQTRPIKKFISNRFRSARGIEEGINGSRTDMFNLRSVKLYEHRNSLEYIFQKIEAARESKAWLIFYTHDVREDHTEWGCSPAYFEAVVKKCMEEKIKVLTINEAINHIESEL